MEKAHVPFTFGDHACALCDIRSRACSRGGLAGVNTGFIAASYTDAALDSQGTGPVGRFSGANTGRVAADNVWGGDPSVPQTHAGNDD